MQTRGLKLLGVLLAALLMSACGIKGALEAPAESKADTTAQADSGQGKPEGAASKPHKGFILDGILR